MEKNAFLLFNDIVSSLYTCRDISELRTQFLSRLNALIPYSYASILLTDPKKNGTARQGTSFSFLPPLCVPEYFADAESSWVEYQKEDYLAWISMSPESILVRESEVLSDEQRLNSYIYKHCYHKYNIYDSLQYAIISDRRLLGIITLLRTRIDEAFSDDDTFFLRSLGIHMTTVFKRFTYPDADFAAPGKKKADDLIKKYSLTSREAQVLTMVLSFADNTEICESLGIKENTLQKHLQNLFRKMGVSSRWEAAAKYYK